MAIGQFHQERSGSNPAFSPAKGVFDGKKTYFQFDSDERSLRRGRFIETNLHSAEIHLFLLQPVLHGRQSWHLRQMLLQSPSGCVYPGPTAVVVIPNSGMRERVFALAQVGREGTAPPRPVERVTLDPTLP